MRHLTLVAPLAAAALALPAPARANCCVFGDPLLAIHDVSGREGGARLSVETVRDGIDHALDDGMEPRVDRTTLTLRAVHSPRERWVIAAALPLVALAPDHGGGHGQGSGAGALGDADVEARLALWREVAFLPDPEVFAVTRARALALSIGASLPTGATGVRVGDVRLARRFQPGSGAVEPHAALLFRQERGAWGLEASASARLPLASAGYRRGPSAALMAGAHRKIGRFALGLDLDARAAGADRRGGDPAADTGGVRLAAAPRLEGLVAGGLWASAGVMFHVATALRGDQHEGPVWSLALHYEVRR